MRIVVELEEAIDLDRAFQVADILRQVFDCKVLVRGLSKPARDENEGRQLTPREAIRQIGDLLSTPRYHDAWIALRDAIGCLYEETCRDA